MHDGALVLGPVGRGNGCLDGLNQHVKVDVVMSGNGDDRGVLGDGAVQERLDLSMRFHGSFLGNEVNFVLNDDDVFDASDFQRHQVLTRLWLRARFVGSDHQHRAVHDGSPGDHDGHQGLVAWGVDK